MHEGKFVFSQLINVISKYEFNKCVDKYQGNLVEQMKTEIGIFGLILLSILFELFALCTKMKMILRLI
ncbi:MAG: DUF4372 domain-containing protein [Chitinophagales bacterium]